MGLLVYEQAILGLHVNQQNAVSTIFLVEKFVDLNSLVLNQ
jgi:hypothetical protein